MADPVVFQIETGVLAFIIVDTAEVGYLPAWNAPGGATAETAAIADYEAESDTWSCQVSSGQLSSSPDTGTTTEVPATFCSPARSIPAPGETSFTLDVEFLQDPNVETGLSQFLFEHDTEEAYFLLGLNGANPPKAVGRVRVQAGAFGGAARTALTATLSLPVSQKPDIAWGITVAVTAAASSAKADKSEKVSA
jgi:hypothetical protein